MNRKEEVENVGKIVEIIEKHGLGLVSFLVLMMFFGYQAYNSDKMSEKFFELKTLNIQQLAIMNERLTNVEKIMKEKLNKK